MSGNELTMDEKYFDLQNKLIETRLSSIASALEKFGQDVKKVLDDHETRLREQAKAATTVATETATLGALNTQELMAIKGELKEQRAEIACLRDEAAKRLEDSIKERDEKNRRELTLWQSIAVEALKYSLSGVAAGGVIAAVIKLLGA